ncbi:MAG: hypothetical protein HUK12_00025 [Muribaculaceae bacterium]|nr:hypothetical protein [Muribaculaceae bacterium]MCF0221508.1 hypothetical protein [Fibrobacter sp.]
MEWIPYLMDLGKFLGWPAVVVAVILIFVIRDLTKRVSSLETEKKALSDSLAATKKELEAKFESETCSVTDTITKRMDEALSKVAARLEKLESADVSIKSEFKEELSKIYEKINAMSENIAVLKDRSDRKEKKEGNR